MRHLFRVSKMSLLQSLFNPERPLRWSIGQFRAAVGVVERTGGEPGHEGEGQAAIRNAARTLLFSNLQIG